MVSSFIRILICSILILMYNPPVSAQNIVKDHKKFLRNGISFGLGHSVLKAGKYNVINLIPHYALRVNFNRLSISISQNSYSRTRAPLFYRKVNEKQYYVKTLHYDSFFSSMNLAWNLSTFFLNSACFAISLNLELYSLDVLNPKFNEIRDLSPSGEPILIKKYDQSPTIAIGAELERIYWIKNKKFTISFMPSIDILNRGWNSLGSLPPPADYIFGSETGCNFSLYLRYYLFDPHSLKANPKKISYL